MKTYSNISEILFFTATTFSERELCEINEDGSPNRLTPSEKWEAACWNGLLSELLPEITSTESCDEKLFLWQVERGKSFLRISMGVYPPVLQEDFAIDPHVFLRNYNIS